MIPERRSGKLLLLMNHIQKTGETSQPETLLTRRELAKLCKVSTRTVDNWVSSGKIPLLRISRRCVRFSLADVVLTLKSDQDRGGRNEQA